MEKEIKLLEERERKKYEEELIEDLNNLIQDFVHNDDRFRYLKRSAIIRILKKAVEKW